MIQNIKGILFDLGDTLMYSPNPWPPVFERAGRKLTDFLCANGVSLDCDSFEAEFREQLDIYYGEREINLLETSTMKMLQDLLAEKRQRHVSENLLIEALNKFYAVTQQNWVLESDTISTLTSLRNSGFRLGVISNAGDNRDVLQLIQKFGIQQYFDFVLTSAACGFRKPHPRIFQLAVAHWGYMPNEVVMIGDRLDADVNGARSIGIHTIWIKRRVKEFSMVISTPDATVETLIEIPSLLIN